MKNKILGTVVLFIALYISISFNSGCAQIGMPTGGVKDTLAPVLVKSSPALKSTEFSGNKITLNFDEYVTVHEPQNNIIVSPLPKINPNITNNLKSITIKLRDTLQPNTTYSIQFGNAIRDINEDNIVKNFTYVFSTGKIIDSLTLTGLVLLAETGLPDSTVAVILYRNINDTAIQKLKPDYMARVNGDGSFSFKNLPAGDFKIYALKDGDGNKYYSTKTELFAFLPEVIHISEQTAELNLFAYEEEKAKENKVIKVLKPALEKKLKYSNNLTGNQDLLTKFELNFNNPLSMVDTNSLVLTDTLYKPIKEGNPTIDSSRKTIAYHPVWTPGAIYRLIITPESITDSAGNKLAKKDTITFTAKQEEDYGRVTLRFKNYDPSKNPVIQLLIGESIKYTAPITSVEWTNKRIIPGEYELRILYDDNKDNKWTPGNYSKKIQPEKAITLPKKIAVRADWDNENDISL